MPNEAVTNPLSDASSFSALIAPLIDRTAISVHNAISKDALTALRGDHRFHPGALALIAGSLAAGPISGEEYSELTRYQHFGPSDTFLAGLADRGAIVLDDTGGFTATPAGLDVCKALVALQGETNEQLFRPRQASLNGLRAILDQAVAAAATDPHSLLARFTRRSWMPDDASDAAHIWNNSVVLRMHRADAHANAWKAEGLDAQTMRQLPPGAQRIKIEEATNRNAAFPWAKLSNEQRLTLLAGLGALPGTGSPI